MRFLLGSFLLIIAHFVYAMNVDAGKPIHIEADNAEFNRITGVSTYAGNVIVTQGSSQLLADKVVTQGDKNNNVIDLIATGNPAHYQAQPDPARPVMKIHANTIHYHVKEKYLELVENAQAVQNKDTIDGPHLIYHLVEQTLTSPGKLAGRTTIVLQPRV